MWLDAARNKQEADGKVARVSELAPALQWAPAVFKPVPPRARRPLATLLAINRTCQLQHSYTLLSSIVFFRLIT